MEGRCYGIIVERRPLSARCQRCRPLAETGVRDANAVILSQDAEAPRMREAFLRRYGGADKH